MSHSHPKYKEVIERHTTKYVYAHQFGKHYLNLASKEFNSRFGRYPNLDDSNELMQIFKEQWHDYYSGLELSAKEAKHFLKFYPLVKEYHIDVEASAKAFCSEKYPKTYIVENGLLNDWLDFAIANKDNFKYKKVRYKDYSHLAYNGVTDDF